MDAFIFAFGALACAALIVLIYLYAANSRYKKKKARGDFEKEKSLYEQQEQALLNVAESVRICKEKLKSYEEK